MCTVLIFFAIFGALSLTVFSFDLYKYAESKLRHRRLGGWRSEAEWENAVKARAIKWMKKTPTVPLRDGTRLILVDVFRGCYRHRAAQNWQAAPLISGLIELGEASAAEHFKLRPSSEIDDGYLLYSIVSKRETMTPEIQSAVDGYIELVEKRTMQSGLISYREGYKTICIVDTVAFVCPMLIWYGERAHNEALIEKAMLQIRSYRGHAYLPEYGLYAHGYDSAGGMPCESLGWGRGTGWYLLGLLDSFNSLGDGSPYRSELFAALETAAADIMRFQGDDGGWHTQLVSRWNYDSSATAMFAFALYSLYELTGNERYRRSAESAKRKIMNSTASDGAVELCEGDCHGIGRYSSRYSVSPFTQGITLRMIAKAKEVEKGESKQPL